MKKVFAIFILLMFICQPCLAGDKTYIIYNDDTQEVYSLSDKDDAVMPESGYTKVVLNIHPKKLGLDKHSSYYKYKNGDLILNNKKISDEAKAEEDAIQAYEDWRELIDSAKAKLIGLGLTEEECDSFLK